MPYSVFSGFSLFFPLGHRSDGIIQARVTFLYIEMLPPKITSQISGESADAVFDCCIDNCYCYFCIVSHASSVEICRTNYSINVVDDHDFRVNIDWLSGCRLNQVKNMNLSRI